MQQRTVVRKYPSENYTDLANVLANNTYHLKRRGKRPALTCGYNPEHWPTWILSHLLTPCEEDLNFRGLETFRTPTG